MPSLMGPSSISPRSLMKDVHDVVPPSVGYARDAVSDSPPQEWTHELLASQLATGRGNFSSTKVSCRPPSPEQEADMNIYSDSLHSNGVDGEGILDVLESEFMRVLATTHRTLAEEHKRTLAMISMRIELDGTGRPPLLTIDGSPRLPSPTQAVGGDRPIGPPPILRLESGAVPSGAAWLAPEATSSGTSGTHRGTHVEDSENGQGVHTRKWCMDTSQDDEDLHAKHVDGEVESNSPMNCTSAASLKNNRGFGSLVSALSMTGQYGDCAPFKLASVWAEPLQFNNHVPSRRRSGMVVGHEFSSWSSDCSSEAQSPRGQCAGDSSANMCVLTPNSPCKAMWDGIGLLMVIYDMIMIPLELFDLEEDAFRTTVTWIARLVWTLDIPLSFVTGYVLPDGKYELRKSKIAKKYLWSWFFFDLCLVVMDWLETSEGASHGALLRLGKASRFIRVLRLVRLLRLARMRGRFAIFAELLRSEKLMILADITNHTIITLGCSHVAACFWYFIGSTAPSGSPSWLHQYQEQVNVKSRGDLDFGSWYSISFHWSLSQLTGGMDEIRPSNTQERIFALAMFIIFFLLATLFVGSLTSSMTRLEILSSRKTKQLSKLRHYLQDYSISAGLTMRVMSKARHVVENQHCEPELLSTLEGNLKADFLHEVYTPVLAIHPFFSIFLENDPQVMRHVCSRGISSTTYLRDDIVFRDGDNPEAPHMMFIETGKSLYRRHVFGGFQDTEVGDGTWCCEAALWVCPWVYHGELTVFSSECRICSLDAKVFQDVVGRTQHSVLDPRAYANRMVLRWSDVQVEPTDLPTGIEEEAVADCLRHLDGQPAVVRPKTVSRFSSSIFGDLAMP
eukprot:TRINITY_DN21693_c0_g1_i2.p1 TRINITY_DN21693_c0_g1~~TRINITY_DN21693_c0_g1_i2.p1  ORF type:complete len:847 (-),score=107.54 TRINITY_DN21693_c0_g1_i2:47-2587(-)